MTTIEPDVLKGLLIIFATLAGGFVYEIMGCKLQKHLKESMPFKHTILFIIIYSTVAWNKYDHPINSLILSSMIYILFIMSMRLNIYFTSFTFILIFILVIMIQYRDYIVYHKKDKKTEEKSNYFIRYTEIALILTIIVGFINYTINQYNDHKNFSIHTFLIGNRKCASIKT